MAGDPSRDPLDSDLAQHIFSASAGMIGVCITVIGLFRISDRLKHLSTIGDDLLAVDALAFLMSCTLAYVTLRTRARHRRYRLEQWADGIFLVALAVMAIICGLIAYELV